jgi:sporulation protein YlmC with PRC-barrel domain
MRRTFLIATAAALSLTWPALAQQPAPSQPQVQPPAQGPGSVEVRPADPQIRIETAPPEIKVETQGEPQIRVVNVPTVAGKMPQDFVGKTVHDQQGKDAGVVRDFVLAGEDGSIESLVLTRGGVLGIGQRTVAVPWQRVRVNPDNADMVVTMTEDELKDVPDFEYSQEARVIIGPEAPKQ